MSNEYEETRTPEEQIQSAFLEIWKVGCPSCQIVRPAVRGPGVNANHVWPHLKAAVKRTTFEPRAEHARCRENSDFLVLQFRAP